MRLRTRHAGAAVALALALVAATYAAQTATDVGDSYTSGGQAGDVAADSITARNVNNQGDGHRFVLQDNQARCAGGSNDGLACPSGAGDCPGGSCVTPTPVAGTSGQLKIYDDNVTATEAWTLALGTTEYPLSRVLLDVEEGGTQVCDNATTLDFSALFSVTTPDGGVTCEIAPGTQIVVTSDGNIKKADLPSLVAYEDEQNPFSVRQDFNAGLTVPTPGLDCGVTSSGACRYSGAYSNADDVATKGDVDGDVSYVFAIHSPNRQSSNLGTQYFFSDTGAGGTTESAITIPVPASCSVRSMVVRMQSGFGGGNVPTGDTYTWAFRKNASATGQITCAATAGQAGCANTSPTPLPLTASTDYVTVGWTCTGTCTDTTAQKARVWAYCKS